MKGMLSVERVSLREVTRDNWRETLRLAVSPDQQQFIAEYTPIAALALAKAYVRPGGAIWVPYAIYADAELVGLTALAYEAGSADEYWIFHFFIDHHFQNRGYGTAALAELLELIKREHQECRMVQLVVHPENRLAQQLYTRAGFRPTGAERWGEPVYQLSLIRSP